MENMITMLGEFGLAIALVITFVFGFWKVYTYQREDNLRREQQNLDTITKLSGILSENSRALLKNGEALQKVAEKLNEVDEKISDLQQDVNEIKIRQQNRE